MPTSHTRIVGFKARHRYWRPDWSEERNRQVFGACAGAPGHAHDYRCAVSVTGEMDGVTGMIMDLGLLDQILEEEVLRPLDGKHFNLDVPEFEYGRTIPTGEAVSRHLFARVAARLPAGVRLARVRVQEDTTLYAECTGLP